MLKRVLLFIVLGMLPLFAGDPGVVNTFIATLLSLMQGKVGIIFIVIIMGFSAFFAWRNGNLTPLLWGIVASLIIGAAPYAADQFISWGNSTFGG